MLPDPTFDASWTTTFTREWYASLPAVYRDLDRSEQQLLRFLSLLGDQADEIEQLAQLAEGGTLTSPNATPDALIPWLSQMVGLTTSTPSTADELRARMSSLEALRYAGNPASIELVCRPLLTGDQWVAVRPHEGSPTGNPWVIGVFVREAEAPADLTVLRDAIIRAGLKPAGFDLVIGTVSVSWGDIEALGDQWTDLQQAGETWSELENAA